MTEIKTDILELGRGAKLLAEQKYWHQFVLKFNFLNNAKPFIVSEIGKEFEVSSTNLSIKEIQETKWVNHLKQCHCESLVSSFVVNNEKAVNDWQALKQSENKFQGKWVTPKVIEVLDYKSNHGNWDYTYDIPGKIKVEFNSIPSSEKKCSVLIAVMSAGGPSYFKRYVGRMELAYKYLLIWQNDVYPVKIKYKWVGDGLELELFEKKLLFKKE
jgi:hypothetical protein